MALSAKEVAELLVDSGCYVSVWNEKNWVSVPGGGEVPAYLSCRRLIALPAARQPIEQSLLALFKANFPDAQLIAGLATAGITWAHAIAVPTSTPLCYIRSSKKSYGIGKLVEGNPKEAQRTVLVDDLLFTGDSVLIAKKALAAEKRAEVKGAVFVASLYGQDAEAFGRKNGLNIKFLVNYRDICDAALARKLFTTEQRRQMLEYYENPSGYRFAGR